MNASILVWDLPTRVFHWLLAGAFLGAFITGDSERYRDYHLMFGYTLLGLIGFRLLWGLWGSPYARFRSFAFGPRQVLAYLQSLLGRRPGRFVGHNPAGSWAIYLLLTLGLVTGVSGYGTYNDLGGEWLAELHEAVANAMLVVVALHVIGVVASSLLHRENLIAAMVTGYKSGSPAEAIPTVHWLVGILLLAVILAFWIGLFG